jgi:hypothetical protein
MGADYTNLLKKIVPQNQVSGDPGFQLRAGVITAVAADGTVSLALAGDEIVSDIPTLAATSYRVGMVVQILTYRGSMLVIGPTSSGPYPDGLGLWARGQLTADSATMGTTLGELLRTNVVTFVAGRVYECRTFAGVRSTTVNVVLDLRAYRTASSTLIAEFFRFPTPVANTAFNASSGGIYFTPTVNLTGAVSLFGAASAGGVMTHVANTTSPRNIEVYDVGDVSKFPGIVSVSSW